MDYNPIYKYSSCIIKGKGVMSKITKRWTDWTNQGRHHCFLSALPHEPTLYEAGGVIPLLVSGWAGQSESEPIVRDIKGNQGSEPSYRSLGLSTWLPPERTLYPRPLWSRMRLALWISRSLRLIVPNSRDNVGAFVSDFIKSKRNIRSTLDGWYFDLEEELTASRSGVDFVRNPFSIRTVKVDGQILNWFIVSAKQE